MPSLELTTNVKVHEAKAFSLEFAKFSAETLKKPELYITSSYTHNETLTFQGTFDPAFVLTITSLDNLSPELNEQYSKAFFGFFHKKLGVSDDRGYIVFVDPGRAYLGYKSVTFETIFGNK
jgi:phenylpyruvate tautomerase